MDKMYKVYFESRMMNKNYFESQKMDKYKNYRQIGNRKMDKKHFVRCKMYKDMNSKFGNAKMGRDKNNFLGSEKMDKKHFESRKMNKDKSYIGNEKMDNRKMLDYYVDYFLSSPLF